MFPLFFVVMEIIEEKSYAIQKNIISLHRHSDRKGEIIYEYYSIAGTS